jgi:hypothetical protein
MEGKLFDLLLRGHVFPMVLSVRDDPVINRETR